MAGKPDPDIFYSEISLSKKPTKNCNWIQTIPVAKFPGLGEHFHIEPTGTAYEKGAYNITCLWLVGNEGMGYNYNYYYYHSSIPY